MLPRPPTCVRSIQRVLRLLATALPLATASAETILEGGGSFESVPLKSHSTDIETLSLFSELDSATTGISFTNRYDDPDMWGRRYREFTLGAMGTGIAIGDFDGDGQPDIYAVSKTGPNALYRQTTPLSFEDITEAAGVAGNPECWSTGATAVDINNDGHLDIYLCNVAAPNQLFVNDGQGRFEERAATFGIDVVDASVMAAFADYDRDGDLDFYLLTNILDYNQSFKGRQDYLFRNDGSQGFTNVADAAGIEGIAQGHSATWWDFNHDGWPDLYVANDFDASDKLYRNNGDGTFTDVITETLPLTPYFSMGSDLGDVNNDGLTDFFVGDMAATSHEKEMIGIAEIIRGVSANKRFDSLFPMYMRNAFFLNTGTERFNEIAHLNRLDASDWTWSVKLADFDNNGWNDLYITNGNVRNFMEADLLEQQNVAASLPARIRVYKNAPPFKEHNLAFRNEGGLVFSNVSKDWGLDYFGISFGAALSDLDRDGDLDIVINNYQENLKLYRNNATSPGILLQLAGKSSNAFGIGAEITLDSKQGTQVRQLTLARGLLSSDEPLTHFGLGDSNKAGSVNILWPSGSKQTLKDVQSGYLYRITEPLTPNTEKVQAKANRAYKESSQFEDLSSQLGLAYTHEESYLNEFEEQPLLPRRLSQQGPALAWNVNTPSAPQLIIGGAAGYPTTAYNFRSNTFEQAKLPNQVKSDSSETLGIAILDDTLYMANGSVEGENLDRVFKFSDKEFIENTGSLLPQSSSAALAAVDFDRDGDLDLFVGGRSVPHFYPETPQSYLLENRDGVFVDITAERAPELAQVGMVTSAVWNDVDKDGLPDLLLTLDWGSPRLFMNEARRLTDRTKQAGLAPYTGWWNSVAAGDFNNDGLIDFAAGNLGLNTKYLASPERPTILFWGDLDGSGKRKIVEAQFSDEDNSLYPIRPYSKLKFEFPFLSDKFTSFRDFAQATLEQIFPPDKLNAVTRLEATTLASGVFLNLGNGRFEFSPLPRMAQIAPVYGLVAQDLTGDGHTDLFLAQNSFAPEPSTGRFNGGLSLLLEGDGTGSFSTVPSAQSGIVIEGDAKAAISADLQNDGWPDLIIAQNSAPVRIYQNRGTRLGKSFSVSLKFDDGNPHGYGTSVTVRRKDGTQSYAELTSHAGYLSQSVPKLFFGYKDSNTPIDITVHWPDGSESTHDFPAGAKTLELER